jgi:hypothetical protein
MVGVRIAYGRISCSSHGERGHHRAYCDMNPSSVGTPSICWQSALIGFRSLKCITTDWMHADTTAMPRSFGNLKVQAERSIRIQHSTTYICCVSPQYRHLLHIVVLEIRHVSANPLLAIYNHHLSTHVGCIRTSPAAHECVSKPGTTAMFHAR